MSIPNLLHVVQQAALEFGPLDSHEACAKFTGFVVPRLFKLDPNIGHLKKDPSRTNYQGRAVDACLYLATGQAIDIIGGSKVASPSTPGTPAWSVEEIARYSAADWIKPELLPPGDEEDVPAPPAPKPQPVCQCKAGDVIEAMTQQNLLIVKLHGEVVSALARLENANRKTRPVVLKGGWPVGTIRGEVGGIEG